MLRPLTNHKAYSVIRIPLAGGPFNWVSILAPPWCKNFLSYMAGWLTVITWQAIVAASAYVAGTMIQGLLVLNYPSYDFQRWHGTLLFYAVLGFALLLNTFFGWLLPQVETLMLLFHILGFFAVLIPLVSLAPHQSASEVFTRFQNLGGWSTDGLSFFVGIITCASSFPGKPKNRQSYLLSLTLHCRLRCDRSYW